MVFPVVGGTQDTGYEIENSCQFNTDAYCEFTPSSGSGSTQFTISAWVKNCGAGALSEDGFIVSGAGAGSGADNGLKLLSGGSNGKIQFIEYAGGSDAAYYIRTNRLFRDPSAWMHVVLIYDAPDGTAGDRMRLYINGTRETSFSHEVQLPQDRAHAGFTRSSVAIRVGSQASGSNSRFNGYLADVYFCDGQNYEPSEFGETDDNGVWIPKKADVSFGTNGFKLEFKQTGTSANASGIGADTSGNDNHFSVSGLDATNITTDTPTNNFCTMNPIYSYSGITFSEGNLQTNLGGSNHRWGTSTFFVANGKWYFECKLLSDSNYNSGPGVIAYGIDDPITTEGGGAGSKAEGWIYLSTNAGDLQHGGTQYGTASAATTNDILMVAFDVDNGKIWIGKNGTWSEGSNPSTGNGAVREDLGDASSGLFSPAVSGYAENMVFNFGNPTFSISSGNADANGYGNFEYAVPSGFYSLCTKNLAEYG
jgi:hypothetical protein